MIIASFSAVSSVYAYGGNQGNCNGSAVCQQLQTEVGLGLYHDEILVSFSEALNNPVEDLKARIDACESIK